MTLRPRQLTQASFLQKKSNVAKWFFLYIQPGPSMMLLVYDDPSKIVNDDHSSANKRSMMILLN